MPQRRPSASPCPATVSTVARHWLGVGLAMVAMAVIASTPAWSTVSAPHATLPGAASAPAVAASAAAPAPVVQRVRLAGDAGMPTLPAYWFLPRESGLQRTQPLPVVVALHGCGGLEEAHRVPRRAGGIDEILAPAGAMQARYREYAHWLTERGYAVLMPDSFGPRGKVSSGCGDTPDARGVDDRTRRADALAALRWVARQPGIDPRRIVLLGWSNGAQGVLATIDASRPWPAGTPAVERAVAFYPACKRVVRQHNFKLRAPVLMMIGGADDWTPATRCAMLQNAVLARQPDARFRLEIYPGAYHGFDGTSELHRADATRRAAGTDGGGDAVARVAALAQLDSWLTSPDP